MGRKTLASCLGTSLCLIIGLISLGGEGGGSAAADGTVNSARIAELRVSIAALSVAIENNRRREDAQAREGYALSDEEYWGQFERNAQEYHDLVLKKAALEGELAWLTSKRPSKRAR